MTIIKHGFAVLLLCAGTFAAVAPAADVAPVAAHPSGVCFVQHGCCMVF